MKKASQIILLIAGILAVIGAIAYFAASVAYAVAGGLRIALENGTIPPADCPQWVKDYIYIFVDETKPVRDAVIEAFGYAVVYFLFAVFCIPAAVVSMSARAKETQGLYICCIVFGILSGTLIPTIGGIFGLIGLAQAKNAEAQKEEPKEAEEKAEEPQEAAEEEAKAE